jgi:predicted DNA binding CopG/RHH family protein
MSRRKKTFKAMVIDLDKMKQDDDFFADIPQDYEVGDNIKIIQRKLYKMKDKSSKKNIRIKEAVGPSSIRRMRLKDVAKISTNMKDADFWITRRGTPDQIGSPVKEYNKESFGIKILNKDIIDPDYLYYAMMNIHQQGHYKNLGTGSTRLVSIKINNIKNIRLG